MKLQDIVLRNRNSIKTIVDNIKHIAIASNFLFITIFWSCLFFHELFDTSTCSDNAFNGIRCFGTLYLCYFYKLLQFLWLLLKKHLLFSCFFIYCGNQTKNIWIPLLISDLRIIKISHSLTSLLFPYNIYQNKVIDNTLRENPLNIICN